MRKVLIKAMRPHRQKVLTEDGEEMRLQQWANKTASAALRTAGGEASGEQFTQARDALMREAVANPNEHGLKFMGERMPFEGQTLEESLSEPDVEGEQAAVDQEFDPDAEAEHLRRIMTSRDVAIRDAWSVLKYKPIDDEFDGIYDEDAEKEAQRFFAVYMAANEEKSMDPQSDISDYRMEMNNILQNFTNGIYAGTPAYFRYYDKMNSRMEQMNYY